MDESSRPNVVMFSTNPQSGRYGFFPVVDQQEPLGT